MQELFSSESAKLKKAEQNLKDFLNQTGNLPDSTRTWVDCFGRSTAQKAVHASKNYHKGLTSGNKNGKIKSKDFNSGKYINTKYFKNEELKQYTITPERIEKIQPLNINCLTSEENLKLTQSCKELLEYMSNEPVGTEGAFVFQLNMSEEYRYKADKSNGKIKIKDTEFKSIVIHNHPDGLIFSYGDIETFYNSENIIILGAVGNNGSTYFIEKTSKYDTFGFCDFIEETRNNYPIKMSEEEHIKCIRLPRKLINP